MMRGFVDTIVELCVGQGAVDRATRRSFERQYAASIASSRSSTSASDSSSAISSSGSDFLESGSKISQLPSSNYLPGLRSNSALLEHAHPAIYNRSAAFFKCTPPPDSRDSARTLFPIEVDGKT